jgi:tRNA(Ile)-lysidine synthase
LPSTTASHIFRRVVSFIRDRDLVARGDSLLIAVSGGKDSTVLVDILQRLAPRWSLTIHAYHLNHTLRGRESDLQEAFVRWLCDERRIPLTVERADVRRLSRESGVSVEMAGRRLRYERLAAVARRVRAGKILTAHTLSDTLETILLRLVTGTGLQGLTGIPAVTGKIVRPLLCLWTHQVMEYAHGRGLHFFEDTSNLDLTIPRNYIRLKVVPALVSAMDARILKSFPGTLARLAEDRALTVRMERLVRGAARQPSLNRSDLVALPDPLARAALQAFVSAHLNLTLSDKATEPILKAIKSGNRGRRWHISRTHELSLRKGVLTVRQRTD